MFWIRFALPAVTAVLIMFAFEFVFWSQSAVWVVAVISWLWTIFATWLIVAPSQRRDRIHILSVVGGFALSSWLVLFFLSSGITLHLFSILIGFLLYLYLFASFYFFHVPQKYQPFSLDNAGTYIGILTVFFFTTALSGIQIFVSLEFWIILGLVFVSTGLFTYLVFWSNKVWERGRKKYVFLVAFLVTQFFWGLSLLSVSIFVVGVSNAILFYFLTGIIRARLQERLNKTIVMRYSFISVAVFIAVVVSARWS